MAVESIFYSVSGISCRGALIWDESVRATRPLLLMAPELARRHQAGHRNRPNARAATAMWSSSPTCSGKATGRSAPRTRWSFCGRSWRMCRACAGASRPALDTLTREADRRAIGDISRRAAIGFCFGGLNVLDLARTGADVQAVVSMHGTLVTPQPAKRGDIKAAVLAVHGAADPVAPKAERDAFEAEMEAGRSALGAADLRACGACLHRRGRPICRAWRVQRDGDPSRLCAGACLHRGCFCRAAVNAASPPRHATSSPRLPLRIADTIMLPSRTSGGFHAQGVHCRNRSSTGSLPSAAVSTSSRISTRPGPHWSWSTCRTRSCCPALRMRSAPWRKRSFPTSTGSPRQCARPGHA